MKQYIFESEEGAIYSGFLDNREKIMVKESFDIMVPGIDILMDKPRGHHKDRPEGLTLIAIYNVSEVKFFLNEMSPTGRAFFNLP